MDEQLVAAALNDPNRLQVLRALSLLNSHPAPAFERHTRLAARLLAVPVSLISLVDTDRQYLTSIFGLSEPWRTARQMPLTHSFCQYVVADRAPFVVRDAREHPRVANSLAIPDLCVIAYAGVPLITPEGAVLGSLCVIDHEPRDWTAAELTLLQELAVGVMTEIALGRAQSEVQGVSVVARNLPARHGEADALRRLAGENARLYAAERTARVNAEHAAERTARLYAVTAALAQARTSAHVAEVVVGQGIGALGAYAGAMLLRGPDGESLTLAKAVGYPVEVLASWPSRRITDPYPVAEAARTGRPIWLGSLDEGARRYPHLPVAPGSPTQALAAIPLLIDGDARAVIMLSFDTPQTFPADDRAFALALADQCAQALDRARLLESLQHELAERQRAEQALRDNEARLDGILHSAMDAIITVNSEQEIVRFNHAAEQLFGYWAEEMIGQPLERLLPPHYRAAHRHHLLAFGATGVTSRSMRVHQTLAALRANGEEFPIEAAISHVSVAGERWYTVILRDVSARLSAEAALKASEARFTAFMNRIPAAAWICGSDGVVRYVNPSYRQLFTPLTDDPIGKHLRELYPPETADAYLAANQEVIAQGQPQEQTLGYTRQDGTPGQLLAYKFPLAADDTAILVGGVAIDISERAAAEAQQRAIERSLLETQKLESLGVLAGGIAHDFNNLLMTILGNVELALLDLHEHHPAHSTVAQIRTASQRAAELTGQMLAYSGRGQFVVAPLDVNALVEELALLLRASTPKGVSITYTLDPALPAVEADAAQLRQVVMNLVINGAEAIEGRTGQVAIRTRGRRIEHPSSNLAEPSSELPPGEYVVIEVTDTGCGMDDTTLARIFEPFFTTKFTGRGLGLAAVQGIVRAHYGALLVSSVVGRGTTMTVVLPAGTTNPATRPEGRPRPSAPQTASVLVIDDEPEVRGVTTRILGRLGYQVLTAADGEAGLAQLVAHPEVAVVLLDLTMPGWSGEETLRQLRLLRADLPVVVVSGYSETEVRGRVASAGAVEVLQKPFTPAALREVLGRLVGQTDT